MKTLRILLIVLAAALVLNGCSNIFSGKPASGDSAPEAHIPLPAGYGAVKISFAQGAARIAMPAPALTAFDHFEYFFAKNGGEPKAITPEDDLFILEPGSYHVTVRAFVGAGEDTLAATGSSETPFTVTVETTSDVTVTLHPFAAGTGTGTLQFGLTYPSGVTVEAFTLSRLAGDKIYDLKDDATTTATTLSGTLDDIPVGYYLLDVFLLNASGVGTGKTEVVHIYQNLVTQTNSADYTFTADDFRVFVVTNTNDSGTGSLRKAITDATTGSLIIVKLTPEEGNVIALKSRLPTISKNLTIRGNGVTITRDPSWTTVDGSSQLLYVSSGTVTISRIHFKNGRSTDNGGAIYKQDGILTLESCIFSGNRTGVNGGAVNSYPYGSLHLRGCTFFNNVSERRGGAVLYYNSTTGGNMTMAGNLFYGNTATTSGPNVYRDSSGTIISNGYNVSDETLVAVYGGSWTGDTTDSTISSLPVSPKSLRLLSGSGAANVIDTRPAAYPTVDFYGNPIPEANVAAGAVQVNASGSGYTLNMEVNYDSRGTISVSPQPNADGFVSGLVTLTATPSTGYWLAYWLVNGGNAGYDNPYDNPLKLNMTMHTKVEAIFLPLREVTNTNDTGAGSLRQAISDVQTSDVTVIDVKLAEGSVIALNSRLSTNKNLIIRGNGVTITRDPSWGTVDGSSQLLYVSGGTVMISRVWFKDGRSTDNGGAVYKGDGILTLESCIFSGNRTSSNGGAVNSYPYGSLHLRGCTFYNNVSGDRGGAVLYYNGITGNMTMAGNLFYGNTATNGPNVYKMNGTVTSNGYNISNTTLVAVSSDSWTGDTTDATISSLPVSPKSFRLLSGNGAAGVIDTRSAVYPTVDFYGNPIPETNAAAGAVQAVASGSGYTLNMEVNYDSRGTISVSSQPNADGFVSGLVTLTATPSTGYWLAYWLVNGGNAGNDNPYDNPLVLNMTAHTKVEAIFLPLCDVVNTNDSGPGSLRQAISDVQTGGVIDVKLAEGSVIALNSRLPTISKNLIIRGNGVTITRDPSWTTVDDGSQLLYVSSGTVMISRVWFKDGRSTGNGGAVHKSDGTLTLESCIFSGNRTSGNGGAVFNGYYRPLHLRGCTFYNNSGNRGGAVYYTDNVGGSGNMTMAGNLFYGNTATTSGPNVYRDSSGTMISNGYNVSDTPLVIQYSGTWTDNPTDTTTSALPVSPKSLRLLSGSGAAGVIDTRSAVYPTVDFYGNTIPETNAAAGAVQAVANGSGYTLNMEVNYNSRGSVSVSPQLNTDGFVSGVLEFTAAESTGYWLAYWLVDGKETGYENPLTLNITAHTKIEAVFFPMREVTDYTDVNDSAATTPGTLRYALTNAVSGDLILSKNVTPGTSIALTSRLPTINKNLIIRGNGVTITRDPSWAVSDSSQLLYVSGGTVTISRVWFKGGKSTGNGGAIYKSDGILTLESCIFSDNQTSGNGGAVYNGYYRPLHLRGCTFYNNSGNRGGAVYYTDNVGGSGNMTMAGNLFYGNTASDRGPNVYRDSSGTMISNGYNISDTTLVIQYSGTWTGDSTDKTTSELSITGEPFNTTTFAPVSGISTLVPNPPIIGFPTVDFYGNPRTYPGAPGAVK